MLENANRYGDGTPKQAHDDHNTGESWEPRQALHYFIFAKMKQSNSAMSPIAITQVKYSQNKNPILSIIYIK